MGDQREVFGPVASVPTAWRALKEAAAGGDRARRKVTAAVNRARRHAWAQAGSLPPVRVADRVLEGVTCIRLDATVVQAHSDKELAEADFKRLWASPPGSASRRYRTRSYQLKPVPAPGLQGW
jgi:hypothetical protein